MQKINVISTWARTYLQLSILFTLFVFSIFLIFSHSALVATAQTSERPLPVYRFYNESSKHHFYTISEDEKTFIFKFDPNWSYEGVAFNSYSTQRENTEPLYRFYSPSYKGHFYTTSQEERNSLIQNDPNWTYEGIAFYSQEGFDPEGGLNVESSPNPGRSIQCGDGVDNDSDGLIDLLDNDCGQFTTR